MTTQNLERRALLVSIFGAAVMAALGIAFAIIAESDAIMLDGVFSGIGFIMASLTLKVAGLVSRPMTNIFILATHISLRCSM